MNDQGKPVLALFYCQNVPQSGEAERQALEEKYGRSVRFFPIACSGRLEPVHLLKALEEFADAAYVITCPEGACKYFEGNQRAKKRVERTREIIGSIGLERERVGIVIGAKEGPKTLAQQAEGLTAKIAALTRSPVHVRK
ncbi:MAG: hydrogenase iron-sulfur subunit [Deltaproteobacteria bacterium]|nr:hydrogenase iron-sulfur subunit [Deltaproteobacteria bacterium]